MTPLSPKRRDGFPDRDVLAVRVPVDVAGVGEFGDGGGGDEVDFGVGEGFQVGHREAVGEGVDFGVAEELGARVVDGGRGGVRLQGSGGELVGEVFARVEVFEEAGGCFEVFVFEVDGAVLVYTVGLVMGVETRGEVRGVGTGELSYRVVRVGRNGVDEEGRFEKQGLVGCELGCAFAGADV